MEPNELVNTEAVDPIPTEETPDNITPALPRPRRRRSPSTEVAAKHTIEELVQANTYKDVDNATLIKIINYLKQTNNELQSTGQHYKEYAAAQLKIVQKQCRDNAQVALAHDKTTRIVSTLLKTALDAMREE